MVQHFIRHDEVTLLSRLNVLILFMAFMELLMISCADGLGPQPISTAEKINIPASKIRNMFFPTNAALL